MKWSRQKRFFVALGALLGVLVVLALALPVWWPWVFRPLSQQFGLSFARYERKSYARFAIEDVSFATEAAKFQTKRVEGLTPTAWLWKLFAGQRQSEYLQVADWTLAINQRENESGQRASVYTHFQKFEATVARLKTWLPRAEFIDGTIQFKTHSVQVPHWIWTGAGLRARMTLAESEQSATLSAEVGTGESYRLQIDSDSLDLHSTVRIAENVLGLSVQATSFWLTNRIVAEAQFGRDGLLPTTATLQAESFTIPAGLLGLERYQDLKGRFSLEWQTNRYRLKLTGNAHPTQPTVPPIDVSVQASGDLASVFVEEARISAPWMTAELARETRVNFSSPFLTRPATLKVFVDLGVQPWLSARGRLEGQIELEPGLARFPSVFFALSGSKIEISETEISTAEIKGRLNWPRLDISAIQLALRNDSMLSAEGRLNLETRVVEAAELSFRGHHGDQWLPEGISYEQANVTLNVSGPFQKLRHSGKLVADNLIAPKSRILDAAVNWRGEGLNVAHARISLEGSNAVLLAEGAAELAGAAKTLNLSALTLRQDGEDRLALAKPAQISFQPGASDEGWTLHLQPFEWRGGGRQLHLEVAVAWPGHGRANGSIRGINSTLFSPFVEIPKQVELDQVNFAAGWSNGPLRLNLELTRLALETEEGRFSAAASVVADDGGLALKDLTVSSQGEPLATANGFLPVAFYPAQTNVIRVRPDEALRLDVSARPKAAFWNQLVESSAIRLREPELEAHVTGTWGEPLGGIQMRAREVKVKSVEGKAPPVENLSVDVQVKPDALHLKSFTFTVANQPVALSGQVPLPSAFWSSLPGKMQIPDWRKATAQLKVDQAQVAALTPFISDLLTPEGLIEANVKLLPGGKFDGKLTLDGMNTRPLANIGAIRNIEVTARFNDRRMRLDSGVSIGGQPLSITGQLDLRGDQWLKGGHLPPFHIHVTGSNVPLARRVEAIVRADLNLALTNTLEGPPLISGAVRLGDSFFLQDLSALAPGGVEAPQRRPPYFSLKSEPLANWRLNVAVTGERFLKARTPLFNGEVSANLQLQGALKEPLAVGVVKIDSGTVRLPFASLPVTQGFVTLSSDNPYRPELFVTASARVFGYDVKMEVTGSASEPIIQFSSVPPLTSEQILLMLTAGEMPRSDFSFSSQQRAQRMALFLGRSVLSELGLVGDANRLTIRSGEAISETGRPTYSVEYKLDDEWAIVGEYDRFNDYNLMLKWRVFPR